MWEGIYKRGHWPNLVSYCSLPISGRLSQHLYFLLFIKCLKDKKRMKRAVKKKKKVKKFSPWWQNIPKFTTLFPESGFVQTAPSAGSRQEAVDWANKQKLTQKLVKDIPPRCRGSWRAHQGLRVQSLGSACDLWFQVCIWTHLMTAHLMPTHQSWVASCLPNFLSPAFHTHFPPQPAQTAPPGSSSPASPLRCPCSTRTLRPGGQQRMV